MLRNILYLVVCDLLLRPNDVELSNQRYIDFLSTLYSGVVLPFQARLFLSRILCYPGDEVLEIEVRGRNLAEGVPRSFTLNSNEILEALQEPLSGIVSAVKVALEQCPPELAADISEHGMVLTGGGALLRNIDKLLSAETGIHVVIADEPLTCVARGGGKALDMVDLHGGDLFSEE